GRCVEADGTSSNAGRGSDCRNGGRNGSWPPCVRSSCAPSSIQTVERSVSPAKAGTAQLAPQIAMTDTVASNFQRTVVSRSMISSLIVTPPLPVLRYPNADQARVGQKHICRQIRIVAVEEGASDRGGVHHVLDEAHRLPAVLVGQDHGEVQVGITVQVIIGIVIEDARPTIVLPV